MSQEKQLTEKESLQLITEMIQKAKASHFHENGTSAILWGSVIGFCGLFTFFKMHYDWKVGFDIWMLTLIAIVPQVFLSIQEKKRRVVKSDKSMAIDAVWIVYGISIFALVFYMNVIGKQTDKLLINDGMELLIKNTANEKMEHLVPFVPSYGSLLLMLYAIPTLATGIAGKFRPMIIGGIICYALFAISCFTENKYDYLMNGIAGILNWLIPGLLLRSRYLKGKAC
jgi:hypothetical protein